MTTEAVGLSIVIPAYNEAGRLPATLATLRAFLATRPWRSEIVVVDDGSTDRTAAVAQAATAPGLPVRVVSLGANQGKGAAVKRGVAEARGTVVGFMDADLPYALDGIDLAMTHLAAGADLAVGARDLPESSETQTVTWARRLSGRSYSLLVNALAVHDIHDTQCGFKWFRERVAKDLFARVTLAGFAFDVELLVLAQRWGLRIDRLPVRRNPSHGSKIRLVRDSVRIFWDLLKVNRRLACGAYDPPPGGIRRIV